jgi:hypothetical protein
MTDEALKAKNYDKTSAKRGRKSNAIIKDAGLSNLKVVMLKEHAEKVREYARTLYEAKGFTLDKDSLLHRP